MRIPTYYYRFRGIGIDFTDEKEIKKYNSELLSFDDLADQFRRLRAAFENKGRERADIMINVLPEVSGVAELSVFHNIKRKLFSKEIKKQCFSLCITKYNSDELGLYFYDTSDIGEVETIFEEFVKHQKLPTSASGSTPI